MALNQYGWNADWQRAFDEVTEPRLLPGRIITEHRGTYSVHTESGELICRIPGRMRHLARRARDLPAVGDWVAVKPNLADHSGQIRFILPRTSTFVRKEAGRVTREQVIAANTDFVFIVNSLNTNLSIPRVERYLALVCDSGAHPVVLLSKSDLADDVDEAVEMLAPLHVPVIVTSAVTGQGMPEILEFLRAGKTGALVGSSGVGKSTLVNALIGEVRLDVQDIRDDGKGRHTTIRRELLPLPNGGVMLDTPGMRELQLWDVQEGLADAFDDIEALAPSCRFTNCRHINEPGCAVLAAVDTGEIEADRLDSYHRLRKETQLLESRQNELLRAQEKQKARAATRAFNTHVQRKKRG